MQNRVYDDALTKYVGTLTGCHGDISSTFKADLHNDDIGSYLLFRESVMANWIDRFNVSLLSNQHIIYLYMFSSMHKFK